MQFLNIEYGISPILLAVAAFALPLLSLVIKNKRFFDAYALVFGIVALYTSIKILHDVLAIHKPIVYPFGGWPPPVGIIYEVDTFGAVLGLLVSSVMLLIILYSWWYTKDLDGYVWYYTLLLGMESGLLGCIYTGDAFNLFVMLEVLGISAYGLVAFYRFKHEAVEAAIKYAMIGAAATTIYFIALVFLYGSFQTLNMADIALKARGYSLATISGGLFGNPLIASAIALSLSLWVFTFKAALFPNHFWLPDAHPEAPTPVSAALSGLVVKVGVYASIRFLYTMFGQNSIIAVKVPIRDILMISLLILGIASAFVGAMMMAVQKDVKRLLAYSTINHIGIIFMAIGLGISSASPEALRLAFAAAIFHIINHSIGKSLLFMSTGVMIKAVGSRDLDTLSGIGKLMPIAGISTIIGSLHLLGVIPLAGFFSKFMLYQAFLALNQPLLAVILVLTSAISLMGYAKLIAIVIGKPSSISSTLGRIKEDPIASLVLIILSIACIALTVLLPLGFEELLFKAGNSILNHESYISSFFDTMNKILAQIHGVVGG